MTVLADSAERALGAVVSTAGETRVSITGIEVREPDLEAVFLDLTGRALRD